MKRGTRVRRSPDEARRIILEAAEEELLATGPDGLRLKAVAERAGVSHPTVLHYFGDREGLIGAVVGGAMQRLQGDLIEHYQRAWEEDEREYFLRAAALFADRGYGRLLAWLVLTGRDVGFDEEGLMRAIATALHARRVARFEAQGLAPPEFEDSLFLLMTVSLALFGEAVCGPRMRTSDPAMAPRFRAWMADLFVGRSGL